MADPLQAVQQAFAAHIRDPDTQPAPADVEDRRMKVYRDLFFNNINKFLSSNFPVLRAIYTDQAWKELVRAFYSEHFCQTPLFPELPREFLRYVQEKRQSRPGDPPFLLELAHYEWVELALALDENELDESPQATDVDLLGQTPILSPLAWPLTYQYPVHKIGPEFQPETPPTEATHLLAYRNRADDIRFMELNAVTQLLLRIIKEHGELNGLQMLEEIASQLNHPSPENVINNGHQLLMSLYAKDIILAA